MPLKFRKIHLSSEAYESAGVFDINNDGALDIVCGAWWYEGPDFRKRHKVTDLAPMDEYYDDFATMALDVNGNGRTDFLTGGWWSQALRWHENPGDPNKEWPAHEIAKTGNVETARAWDLDGDGDLEFIPNTPGHPLVAHKLIRDEQGRGTGEFQAFVLRDSPQGHGLGCGDINGNGRADIVLADGWLEAPEDTWKGEWKWRPEFNLPHASVPILVVDLTGNGLGDLIVGCGHGYGLDWYEQVVNGDGERQWRRHPIDPFNAQYHDMKWIDIDGDGQKELVTGKRWRAHNGNDPGGGDYVGLYYFKWNGEGFSKQIIDYGPPRIASGAGIHFDMADLTGNGLPDIVAPGKEGLFVFFNEGMQS